MRGDDSKNFTNFAKSLAGDLPEINASCLSSSFLALVLNLTTSCDSYTMRIAERKRLQPSLLAIAKRLGIHRKAGKTCSQVDENNL